MKGTLIPEVTQMDPRWCLVEHQRNFGNLNCQHGSLPLDQIHLQGAIRGMDFSLRLEQSFVNVHDHSIEAIYIFPMPAKAAVSRFVMKCQDRVIEGKLQERGQARQEYQQAIQSGQQAALVEEERPDVFTITVGNLPAHERVSIELHLDGQLACIDEVALFRFPLVVAPRYIPGRPLPGQDVGQGTSHDTNEVRDASRITPPVLLAGYPNPVKLSIEIEIDSPLVRWQDLQSTLPLQLAGNSRKKGRRQGPQIARLVYKPQSGQINQDFILVLPFHPDQTRLSLQVQESSANPGLEWPFCVTLVPPGNACQQTQEKHVIILLDRSGSMEGWKMRAAQKTCRRLLESLNDQDAFRVLSFAGHVRVVEPPKRSAPGQWFRLGQGHQLVEASQVNLIAYSQAIYQVEAGGGTEILPALEQALDFLTDSDDEIAKHIVLITDGQVGNERQILSLLDQRAAHVRVSTIGIDEAVNASFLESVASSTNGLCQLVQNDEELDRSMSSICRRIGNPSLRNIQLSCANAELEITSQHYDLYPGVVTRIYGRILGELPSSFSVQAEREDGSLYHVQLEPALCHGTVEKVWAREWVLAKEHAFEVSRTQNSRLAQQITEFSLRYGVLCRFTAFLAINSDRKVPGQRQSVVQAVQQPAGWAQTEKTKAISALKSHKSLPTSSSSEGSFDKSALVRDFSALLSQMEQATRSSPRASYSAPPAFCPDESAPAPSVGTGFKWSPREAEVLLEEMERISTSELSRRLARVMVGLEKVDAALYQAGQSLLKRDLLHAGDRLVVRGWLLKVVALPPEVTEEVLARQALLDWLRLQFDHEIGLTPLPLDYSNGRPRSTAQEVQGRLVSQGSFRLCIQDFVASQEYGGEPVLVYHLQRGGPPLLARFVWVRLPKADSYGRFLNWQDDEAIHLINLEDLTYTSFARA